MSEILKTEAIVLKKMNFRESSKIAAFYTKDHGKISAIIKGARSSKSQIGHKIDLLNHLQIVVYNKESRELQILTQAELINHFGKVKEDLDKLKYASAVLEITDELTLEGESNEKLFRGVVKILNLFENSNTLPGILLIKFILFIIKELGYELILDKCSDCGKEILPNQKGFFSFEKGIICQECKEDHFSTQNFSQELFNLLTCLNNKSNAQNFSIKEVDRALNFLEKYLKYHIPEFKGIQSIHLY